MPANLEQIGEEDLDLRGKMSAIIVNKLVIGLMNAQRKGVMVDVIEDMVGMVVEEEIGIGIVIGEGVEEDLIALLVEVVVGIDIEKEAGIDIGNDHTHPEEDPNLEGYSISLNYHSFI